MFVLGCAHITLQAQSCSQPMFRGSDFKAGHLPGLWVWIEDEAPLHSFPTNFEPKSNKIFCGLFCYHGII